MTDVVINSSPNIDGAPQCQYFVVRKKRLCRMTVRPGRSYCGEHEPRPQTPAGKDDTRIPCPYDPKHTCYASKLEKHLVICNARAQPQPSHMVAGVNAPPERPDGSQRVALGQVPPETLTRVIDKINTLYEQLVLGNVEEFVEQAIHPAVSSEWAQEGRGEGSRRHLRQASALLRLAQAEGLVQDGACYVELGAGKGQLSCYVWAAWGERACGLVLVDRAALRHKRDNRLRGTPKAHAPHGAVPSAVAEEKVVPPDATDESTVHQDAPAVPPGTTDDSTVPPGTTAVSPANTTVPRGTTTVPPANTTVPRGTTTVPPGTTVGSTVPPVVRLRADLAHLALEKVPLVASSSAVVGFAKHLCGIATDYALRCMSSAALGGVPRGLLLATCCHHRCTAQGYVALQRMRELGVSEEELNVMLGVVSWATCGDGRSRMRRAEAEAEAVDEAGDEARRHRCLVGQKAKALLDWGRVEFLRSRGFSARLARFVPEEVSPENLCIVATAPPLAH